MSSFNKIFAAVLIAGIAAYLSSFIANKVVHSEELEQDAVVIAGKADDKEHHAGEAKKDDGVESVDALLAGADIERGAKVAKACAACHSFDKGGATKTGPALWDVIGRARGSVDGFKYSKGMEEIGGSWDYASLNEFLFKPKAYIKGTKMTYAGIKKTEDRAAVIAWLRTLADSPAALPEVGAAAPAEEAPAAEAPVSE